MGVNYSCAQQWRAMAEEALLASGRVTRGKWLCHINTTLFAKKMC